MLGETLYSEQQRIQTLVYKSNCNTILLKGHVPEFVILCDSHTMLGLPVILLDSYYHITCILHTGNAGSAITKASRVVINNKERW